jgi:hypothetical protein
MAVAGLEEKHTMQPDYPLSDLLNQLAGREPEVPNGWFRWMHYAYFGRCGAP